METEDAPLYLTPMVRAWQCRKRGLCCKHQSVQIDEVERRRFERRLKALGDPRAATFDVDKIKRESDWPLLPKVGDQCTFLGGDNLCTVRTHIGAELYPRVCKKFPYLSILTDDRQIVDLTFQCPTALQLLAEETTFEPVMEQAEAPVDSVAWMGKDDRHCWDHLGKRVDIHEFWTLHWALFEHFKGMPQADPYQRLCAFAQDVTGFAAPEPLTIDRALLRQGAFENSIVSGLEARAGGSPYGLPSLWVDSAPQAYTLDPLPPLDEHALLTRYLLHRFLCPTFYLWFADPRYLLTTMFAMLARYRIERERGYEVLDAVRQLDRFFVHSASGASLFATESTFMPWRAMASLAGAVVSD